jgi:signal transduction histidine kinase
VALVADLTLTLFYASTQWEGGIQLFTISYAAYQRILLVYSVLSVVFTLVISVVLVSRWFRGSPAYRQVMGPVLLVGAIPGAFLIVVADHFGPAVLEAMLTGFYLTNIFMALALVFGMLRTRLVGTVGELVVDLSRPLPPGGLRAALARSLRDPSLEVVFHVPRSGWVDGAGERVELPAEGSGRAVTILREEQGPIAALIHDAAWLREPEVVEATAAAARLALENERLHAELRAQLDEVRASRARIVEAADGERRRLERDLHDGAQQRLVSVGLVLREAQSSLNGADPTVAASLEEAVTELRGALSDLRELARGIHPAILSEEGVEAAVDSLATRSTIPVTLALSLNRGLSPQVEATVYFVVSEALTNIAKHAHATRAEVRMRTEGDRIVVQVVDDGVGGASVAAGSGLRGLADRVAALDGRLEVSGHAGGGTRVVAEIPCGPS